jgi:transcriptional regulator with XRE-family HTH domain
MELAHVGERLRAARRQRGETLAQVAAATDLSASTLSRLESGARRPTIEHLLALARHHGTTVDALVAPPPTPEDPRVHAEPVHRGRMTYYPLTRRAGEVQAFKQVIAPRADEPDLRVHDGYEWLYVLSGDLRLLLGAREFLLRAGEAAEFDTRVPHWFGCAGSEPVEVLILFGRHGERCTCACAPAAEGALSPRAASRSRS